ncbi:hypothetical protein Fcan01_20064 [Folsomia candida]|uniref:Uncharacterized protein n=1 Tax=Folsomia candida TaxID=158441 RepID=A0A226DJV9_FOLCA|nr:hypothetical protein Fcan01_20064 [Folsomia candida]
MELIKILQQRYSNDLQVMESPSETYHATNINYLPMRKSLNCKTSWGTSFFFKVKMLETVFSQLFRNGLVVSQRCTFYLAYYFEFDKTTGCIKPVKNWRYKEFQLIWIVATFFVLPGLLVQCYLLFTAEEGNEDKMTIFFTAVSTGTLVMFVLFASLLIRPEGVGRFIACFDIIIVLEKKLLEFLPNPKCWKGAKVIRAVEKRTVMIQLICITVSTRLPFSPSWSAVQNQIQSMQWFGLSTISNYITEPSSILSCASSAD